MKDQRKDFSDQEIRALSLLVAGLTMSHDNGIPVEKKSLISTD